MVAGVPIPAWTFEPTELALPAPAGSYERVVSFNRASYSDFLSTSAAEVAANMSEQLAGALASINSMTAQMVALQTTVARLSAASGTPTAASVTSASASTEDTNARSIATAAIVVASVTLIFLFLALIYVMCLRPRNLYEGNAQAVIMTQVKERTIV